jgi:hypothetical protein
VRKVAKKWFSRLPVRYLTRFELFLGQKWGPQKTARSQFSVPNGQATLFLAGVALPGVFGPTFFAPKQPRFASEWVEKRPKMTCPTRGRRFGVEIAKKWVSGRTERSLPR